MSCGGLVPWSRGHGGGDGDGERRGWIGCNGVLSWGVGSKGF